MVIDRLIEQIKEKKNPSIVGIDPELGKIPNCYRIEVPPHEAVLQWAIDVIDAVCDIVPAVKPQMAFFEVFGAEGITVHRKVVEYAHCKGLVVIDDSKRGDIGNTAKAYAFAHLDKSGPINADFLTVSPFLGSDSMEPFINVAERDGKGIFVLVKTSNPGSAEISEARNKNGEKISCLLADYVNSVGKRCIGASGYSSIGAVVGATYPDEAKELRRRMKNSFFLVPGYGAQGGCADDILPCFNSDGLGAVVSSSRGITYKHLDIKGFDGSRESYSLTVRAAAAEMQKDIYEKLKSTYTEMEY